MSTADLPRARTSYAELSGWRIVDIPVSAGHPGQTAGQAGYSVAAKNDVAVAGITSRRPGARVIIADWATYLAVDNVDEAVRRVGEYGGTVTMEPVDAIDTPGTWTGGGGGATARCRLMRGQFLPRWPTSRTRADRVVERDELRRALRVLSPHQRAVLVLRYYAGPDDDAIAAHLGCRVGSVRTHASRSLARLRGAMHLLTNRLTGRPTGRPEES